MKAFLFAAGFGRRMGHLTHSCPKPLLNVGQLPMIAYSLFTFYLWKIEFLVINLHYHGDAIRNYLINFPHFPIFFSEEKDILETAGGIRKAIGPFFSFTDKIIILNSDLILFPKDCDKPNPKFLATSSSCLFLQKVVSKDIYEKTGQKKETSFSFENQVGKKSEAYNLSVFPSSHSQQGNYYYIGYGLLDLKRFFPIDLNIPLQLSRLWEEDCQKRQLVGRLFEGCVWHGGDLCSYKVTDQYFTENWDNILTTTGNKNKWEQFIGAWPQAIIKKESMDTFHI